MLEAELPLGRSPGDVRLSFSPGHMGNSWYGWMFIFIKTWLVVWNMTFMTFHILGMSSSQLTNSYFSEGCIPHQRRSSCKGGGNTGKRCLRNRVKLLYGCELTMGGLQRMLCNTAVAGTRAEQPDSDFGIPKRTQGFKNRSQRVNAPLCVTCTKPSSPIDAQRNSKIPWTRLLPLACWRSSAENGQSGRRAGRRQPLQLRCQGLSALTQHGRPYRHGDIHVAKDTRFCSFPYRHGDVHDAKDTKFCSFPYRHSDIHVAKTRCLAASL